MKKCLVLFSAVIMMNVHASTIPALNLAVKDAVKINCQNSMPVLTGSVVSCEVVCTVSVVKTYETALDIDSCDQGGCNSRSELVHTEVKVVNLVNNKTIFQNLVYDASSVNATIDSAQKVAASSCTKVEFVK